MSLGSILGNAASTTINITMNLTPQGQALGLASDLLGGGQNPIGALTDTLMKGLFGEPDKNGISKINDWDKSGKTSENPLLQMLAEFMDSASGAYGTPHGQAGNWKDELSENDTVNKQEFDAFKQGLTDALTSMLDQSLNNAIMNLGMGMLGGLMGGMGGMNPLGGLGGGNPFGGIGGMGGGSPFGGMGGMGGGSPFGGMGGMGGGSPFGGMGGMNPFAGGMAGLGGALLGGGMGGMAQTGMGFGLGMGNHIGMNSLNEIGTHKDGDNRHFVNEEDRGTAREIGKFMDQHPEIFGKPEYQKDGGSVKGDDKSWAEALSNPDDDGMTGDSMNKFLDAKNIVKDVMLGDTSRTSGTAMAGDALLAGSNVIMEGLSKAGS